MYNNLAKTNQFKLGSVLSYFVIGLNILVGLLYTPYMLRMLGQSEFGLYSIIGSVIAYLSILDFGLGNAIVRYTAKFRSKNKTEEQYELFGMFLFLYSVIGIIVIIPGIYLYNSTFFLFGDTLTSNELKSAEIMILLMIFNLVISFPLSVFGSIITAYEEFVFQKLMQIIRILLNTFLMVIILKYGYKAVGLVIVSTIINVSFLSINFWYCVKELKIKIYFRRIKWDFFKEISFYSFYIFLNIIIDRIYWSTGQLVLGSTSGTASVAVFAIAIQLQTMYLSFSTSISGLFLPKITAMTEGKASNELVSELFIKIGRIQYIVLAFILTSFIIFGKQFILIWAGEDYKDAYTVTLLFFVPLTIPLIQTLGITILQARNDMKFRSILYIFIAVLSFILQLLAAKKYGIFGVAIAIAGALIIGQVVIMNIYYYRSQAINIPKFWVEISKMTIFPLVFGLTTCLIIDISQPATISSLLVSIFIFSIIYIPLCWKTSMNQYEKELISKSIVSIKSLFKKNFQIK